MKEDQRLLLIEKVAADVYSRGACFAEALREAASYSDEDLQSAMHHALTRRFERNIPAHEFSRLHEFPYLLERFYDEID